MPGRYPPVRHNNADNAISAIAQDRVTNARDTPIRVVAYDKDIHIVMHICV